MNHEKVLAILRRLGFQPELIDESFGYKFEYEGINIILACEPEDSQTILLIVPAIHDITEENRTEALEAMAKLASKFKFVQPNLTLNSVWLNYHHFLGDNEPTEQLIEHMIKVLSFSTIHYHRIINNPDYDE